MMPTRPRCEREASPRSSRCSDRTRFPFFNTTRSSVLFVSRVLPGKLKPLGASVFRRQLNSQPLPPFLPSPAQYFPSPLIGHSCPEAVCLDPPLISWPVCRLAHDNNSDAGNRLVERQDAKTNSGYEIHQVLRFHAAVPLRCDWSSLTFPHYTPTFTPPLSYRRFPHFLGADAAYRKRSLVASP